jgi:uncharacterized LabA/DUF88 family protein
MELPTPDSPPQATAKQRCAVYIDGFNAYYGIFKFRPEIKWLDISRFYCDLFSSQEVVAVKYFTAIVDQSDNPEGYRRQVNYVAALRTLPKVKVKLGQFQKREVVCQARCREKYLLSKEKQTDINIAVEMVGDAVSDLADTLVLVSGDADLQPAVKWIRTNRPKVKVRVLVPSTLEERPYRPGDFYTTIGVNWSHLPTGRMGQYLLPDVVPSKVGGGYRRPKEWR